MRLAVPGQLKIVTQQGMSVRILAPQVGLWRHTGNGNGSGGE